MKTVFFQLAAAVLLILAFAANPALASGQLSYASTKDIRDINPHMYSGEMAAQGMVFEALVENTPEGVKPKLAESWTISPDGKVYTFNLRREVKYSNGDDFNAQSAKKNIEAVLANHQRHAWLELVNQIESVEAPAPETLIIKLKNPYYPTLLELGLTRPFRFISETCLKEGQSKDGVSCYYGTGPWVLSAHKKNQQALFTANQTYWGVKPKLDRVLWRVLPEHQTILMALEKGDVHLIFGADGDMVDMDSFQALAAHGKYATVLSHPIASRAILLNTKASPTDELEVRRSLARAVDRQSIADGILNGAETPALSLMDRSVPYCDVDLPVYQYDPAEAAAALEKAGWLQNQRRGSREKNGRPLKLVFSYNINNAAEKTIAEFLQGEMKDIGVDIVLLGEEKQAFLDRQKTGDFNLQYSLSWGPPYDPQSYFSSFRTPAHADYQAQLGLAQKPEIDKMISELLVTPDEKARQALYARVLGILAEECVYIPLSYSRTKAIHVPALKGVSFNLSQYEIPFEKMYFQD